MFICLLSLKCPNLKNVNLSIEFMISRILGAGLMKNDSFLFKRKDNFKIYSYTKVINFERLENLSSNAISLNFQF